MTDQREKLEAITRDQRIALHVAAARDPGEPTMNLSIEIPADDIRDGIVKALCRGPSIMGQNPLMLALAKAMQENEVRLEAWAREQLATVLADPQFRSDFRREIKTAMMSEAQSLGRKAARAATNAKEIQP